MNTEGKINQIIQNQYNDFKGEIGRQMKIYHSQLRNELGDEFYLKFIEKAQATNPRPIYSIPDEFFKNQQS